MKIKDLQTKQPFYRLRCNELLPRVNAEVPVKSMRYKESDILGTPMSQAEFLEEYYPTAHKVTSELFFPESYGYGEVITEDGKRMETMYREETFRVTVPLQQVTACQHLVHLFGNDTHHELADKKVKDNINDNFFDFQTGWLTHNIDIQIYNAGRSEEITGDGAILFFMHNGKLRTRTFSFLNGDTIFPHYNPTTGDLEVFARRFFSYNEDNKVVTSFIEVWDEKYYYLYRQEHDGMKGLVNRVKNYIGLEGYELINSIPHGFPFVPIAYTRNPQNGPGWNNVQYLAEDIEVALSYWAKACASTANDAYILKGDDVQIKGDPLGRVRAFTTDKDGDVSLLEKKTGGEFYQAFVERLFKEYFRGSFTVETPQLKSGDTPAAAIKLIYSPNLDLAILQAKEKQDFINRVRELFCYGFGMEIKKQRDMIDINERSLSYIIPFVHQNDSELCNNLVMLKNAGLMSTETGAEHNPYTTNAEPDKIMKEKKAEQAADRLYQLRQSRTI